MPSLSRLAVLALTCSACSVQAQTTPPELACHAGAWRLADGMPMVLSPSGDGLRYRLFDGRSGRVAGDPADTLDAREGWREDGAVAARLAFGTCAAQTLRFGLGDAPLQPATRIVLEARDVAFENDGLRLQGRLVLPVADASSSASPTLPSGPAGRHLAANGRSRCAAPSDIPSRPVADAACPPLAVLVHGSEDRSALVHDPLQYLLPVRGIAVFVYDKRGTGRSAGRYTQDFDLLAGDAVAALAAARGAHPQGYAHAGFVGGSQGGWVAPLAASRSDVDYVVALYGLAESPLAEDREQVMNELRDAGFGADVLAQARELTDATAVVMGSRFREGIDALRAVRAKYAQAPWFAAVRGEFSGRLLAQDDWGAAAIAQLLAYDVGTSWRHDPMPVLEALALPQLWVVAADDREAPPAETLRRLRALQQSGRPLDVAVYPRTDHGVLEYAEGAAGRVPLRHPDGYFALLSDWIHRRALADRHGGAQLAPRVREAVGAPSAAAMLTR